MGGENNESARLTSYILFSVSSSHVVMFVLMVNLPTGMWSWVGRRVMTMSPFCVLVHRNVVLAHAMSSLSLVVISRMMQMPSLLPPLMVIFLFLSSLIYFYFL